MYIARTYYYVLLLLLGVQTPACGACLQERAPGGAQQLCLLLVSSLGGVLGLAYIARTYYYSECRLPRLRSLRSLRSVSGTSDRDLLQED